MVKGYIGESRDSYKINVREIINPRADETKPHEVVETKPEVTLWLKMDERDDEKYEKVRAALESYEGDIPVKFKIEGKVYLLETQVRRCPGIEYELQGILGEKNVMFFEK